MGFSEGDIQAVWENGVIPPGLEQYKDSWRKDVCGAWMRKDLHGKRDSEYGWEIDHIDPNGGSNLRNLRPLQWENNASKQDGPLSCPVTASGTNNFRRAQR